MANWLGAQIYVSKAVKWLDKLTTQSWRSDIETRYERGIRLVGPIIGKFVTYLHLTYYNCVCIAYVS